jgi:hypothetical protein
VYLYPGARWQANAGRQQLLCEALGRHVPVVFLSTAERTRSLVDVKRPRSQWVDEGVCVLHDCMSLQGNRWWRRLGRVATRVDAYRVNRALAREGIVDYVYWLSVAEPKWLTGMRVDRLVHDCIDPGFSPENLGEFDEREYAVARAARVVFCTAQTLLERMRRVHPSTHLLNNAASPELWMTQSRDTSPLPTPLQGRPGPIVGYMGTIDWRFDCETVTRVATMMPDLTFCLAGRVNADQEHRLEDLRRLTNVVLTGQVSIEDGPAYTNAFDVGIIPFLPGRVGDAINPVKMYMYLLNGQPVVSTWINECRIRAPLVTATRTPEEFAAAVRAAVDERDQRDRKARVAYAAANTWDHRAREAVRVLRGARLLD